MKTIKRIFEAVGAVMMVTEKELLSKSRNRHLVNARNMAAIKILELGFSLDITARLIGRTDHATIIHLKNRHEDKMLIDRFYHENFTEVCELLESLRPEFIIKGTAPENLLKANRDRAVVRKSRITE